MASPKLQIHLTNPTEAAVALDGKVLGTIRIELKEIETIAGTENPIVVIGECVNSQNGEKAGFIFQELKNLITAETAAVESTTESPEPTTPITKPIAKGA